MPSLLMRRGKRRYRGTVHVQGVRGPSKWFPDDSKKSYRDAVAWEQEQAALLHKKIRQAQIRTASSNVRQWVNDYLDHVMINYSAKTYQEKKAAFERLAASGVAPETLLVDIDRYTAIDFYDGQIHAGRSGNAVNKDRKNLGAAWQWGRENRRDWPMGENPFLAPGKKPEQRHPRYVPPEADYWKVYDHVAGLAESGQDVHVQDRVMLTAYLHLAARRSELFTAKWSDVDFSGRQIRLWTRKREGGTMEYDWLPMTADLAKELKAWAARRLAQHTQDKQHIFVCLDTLPCTTEYHGLPFTQRRHAMARWCKAAGVKKFGWHAIRHLTASILYRRGEPQGVIQAILRHKSATTTARYMRTIGSNEVREVLDKGLIRPAKVVQFDQSRTASGSRS